MIGFQKSEKIGSLESEKSGPYTFSFKKKTV